eukprot:TRINITY_DN22831_c0_g1_i1.p1 TRINITY_DN22831_c0_g1~~TRINITY_DN22831_c0_g1_i1.p1  ORF type:complete len:302 (-),score=49.76 TRINITY_DN22831_c0_g1_i1:519-1424(-)
MYISEDSLALLGATPRHPAQAVADVCCGCGVQGIVALRHFAENMSFLDVNPRALSFVRFNLALNGLEGKNVTLTNADISDFQAGTSCSFDLIVANPPFMPNPQGIAAGASCLFGDGGSTGERVFAKIVQRASDLLKVSGGRLIAVSKTPNAEELPLRLQAWWNYDGNNAVGHAARTASSNFEYDGDLVAGSRPQFHGLVFRGTTKPVDKFRPTSNTIEADRHQAAMKVLGIRTLSQVVLGLVKGPPSRGRAQPPGQAELCGEPLLGLWLNETFLRLVVRTALDSLTAADVRHAATEQAGAA